MSVRSIPQLQLQVARAVVVALGDMDRSIVNNEVRQTGLDSVWDPAGKQEALAAAKALMGSGKLWITTSTKDDVLQNGATTNESVEVSAAAAGAAGPTAATSGPVAGGKNCPSTDTSDLAAHPPTPLSSSLTSRVPSTRSHTELWLGSSRLPGCQPRS